MSAHSPDECPFDRADLEVHLDKPWWAESSAETIHTTYRCRICEVTFEEWVVLQIRQLRKPKE